VGAAAKRGGAVPRRRRVLDWRRRARAAAAAVTDAGGFRAAAARLCEVKRLRQAIAGAFASEKAEAWAAHGAVCDRANRLDLPLADAEATLKDALGRYAAQRACPPEIPGLELRPAYRVTVPYEALRALVAEVHAGRLPLGVLLPHVEAFGEPVARTGGVMPEPLAALGIEVDVEYDVHCRPSRARRAGGAS